MRRALWPSVRAEIDAAIRLVFVIEHELSLPISTKAYVSDSSDYGYALMSTDTDFAEAQKALRHRERWRFRRVHTVAESTHLSGAYVCPVNGPGLLGGVVADDFGEVFAPDAVQGQAPAGAGSHSSYASFPFSEPLPSGAKRAREDSR